MKITCSYCRAANEDDEHRCQRCGRRLLATASQNSRAAYMEGSTAPALRPVPDLPREVVPEPVIQPASIQPAMIQPKTALQESPRRVVFQRSLFSPREVPQVVSLDSIVLPPGERTRTERSKPRVKRPVPGQQNLEFLEPGRVVDTEAEAVIYCDAPVAIPTHRVMAAAVDLSLIVIALGLFVAAFLGVMRWFGIEVTLTKEAVPLFTSMAIVFGLLYKIMWCLADGDSPGMRWTHQRLVNFDGQRPDREQRLRRLASGCLSLMAAGLGVVWALVDEESLTWHDHISKTFPTPY